jgi:hypothetical protein
MEDCSLAANFATVTFKQFQGRELFQVMANVSVLALCQSTPVFLQVETLILVVNEPEKYKSEMWQSDKYVEKLIGILESD